MTKNLLVVLFTLLGSISALGATPVGSQDDRGMVWKAGVARADITPQGPMWMAGWMRDRPTVEATQTIWVKALVLEDPSGNTFVLFTADLCGITAPMTHAITDQIARCHRIPRACVMVNVSHNHAGPYIEGYLPFNRSFVPAADLEKVHAYRDLVVETMIGLASEALADVTPVHLSYGIGTSGFGVNRRNNPEDQVERLRAAGRLRGPVDHAVPVLQIADGDGRIKAVVFGYASHPVVYPDYTWNGDYPGYAQEAVEQRYRGAMAFFIAGAGADNRPMPRGTLEYARKYGMQLAEAVGQVLSGEMEPVRGRGRAAFGTVDLGFASIPTREELIEGSKRIEGASPYQLGGMYARERAVHLLRIMEESELQAPLSAYPYPVQIWKFGEELTLVGMGGEVVVDYSLRLKRELGAGTWVAGYCNDVMGYIPSERVLAEGGYEGADSQIVYGLPGPWAPGIEEAIVGKVRALLEDIGP